MRFILIASIILHFQKTPMDVRETPQKTGDMPKADADFLRVLSERVRIAQSPLTAAIIGCFLQAFFEGGDSWFLFAFRQKGLGGNECSVFLLRPIWRFRPVSP